MERYKIYQSLPEQGLYKNTKTNDTYIITVYPPVRIKNPTETAIKMLKDKAFERPTFIPSIDEINLELPENIAFDPISNTYSSKLGDLVFKSKFLEEVEEKIKKTLLDRKSNLKYILKTAYGYKFSINVPILEDPTKRKRIIKSFKTKEEAMDYRDKFLKLNNMEKFLNSSDYKNFKISKNEIQFPVFKSDKDLSDRYIYFTGSTNTWAFLIQKHYIFASKDKDAVIKCRDEFFKASNLTLGPNVRNPTINWDKVIFPDSVDFPRRRKVKSSVAKLIPQDFNEKFLKPCELYLTSEGELLTEEELIQKIVRSEVKELRVRKVDLSKVMGVSVKIC